MKRIILLPIIFLYHFSFSQNSKEPVKVLLLGTFHFANPGLDVAKFNNADVMTPQRQSEILQVVEQLKKYHPDKIFVEWSAENQNKLDSSFDKYKGGQSKLAANETNQLGFRLAYDLGHQRLYAVDYRKADFPFDSLMKVMIANNQVEMVQQVQLKIQSVQNEFNKMIEKSSITEMLLWQNSDSIQTGNAGSYIQFLKAGDETNHVGSYLASEWWRRNMFIYENILKKLDGKEQRILVLLGSGHTAILREFIKLDPSFEIVDLENIIK